MAIERIGAAALQPALSGTSPANAVGARPAGADFGSVLGRAVDQLQDTQNRADALATDLASGRAVDLHEVVLASEEAQLTFQLAVQVRNKAVEAYQEIMRMQV